MQCQLCQVNEAVLSLKRVVDGELSDLHVCEACAADHGLGGEAMSLGDMLLGNNTALAPPPATVCPVCGLDFEQLRQGGRVGCEQCYEVFAFYLIPLLASMQPGVEHVGSVPVRLQQHETLAELREELGEAVALQDFELAAALRDRIRGLESALLLAGGER